MSHTEGKKKTDISYKVVILMRDVPPRTDAALFPLQSFCVTIEELYNAAQSLLVDIAKVNNILIMYVASCKNGDTFPTKIMDCAIISTT